MTPLNSPFTDLIAKMEDGLKYLNVGQKHQSHSMINMLVIIHSHYKGQKKGKKIAKALGAEIEERKADIKAFEEKTGIKIMQ